MKDDKVQGNSRGTAKAAMQARPAGVWADIVPTHANGYMSLRTCPPKTRTTGPDTAPAQSAGE